MSPLIRHGLRRATFLRGGKVLVLRETIIFHRILLLQYAPGFPEEGRKKPVRWADGFTDFKQRASCGFLRMRFFRLMKNSHQNLVLSFLALKLPSKPMIRPPASA